MHSAVRQEYWDKGYEHLPLIYKPESIEFKDIFHRFLWLGGSCFEVGCYPGNFSIYLARNFEYTVSGIDTTPFLSDRLPKHFSEHSVPIGNLYHEDFMTFTTNHTYDVVCSFGFVEHFSNFEEVIERHIRLVKPHGTLILSCPNFAGLQYFLHRSFDSVNLERHVMEAMNLAKWREVLEQNGMSLLYHGYYRTFDYWSDTPQQGRVASLATTLLSGVGKKIDSLVNWPNRLLSPYMISVSRKES